MLDPKTMTKAKSTRYETWEQCERCGSITESWRYDPPLSNFVPLDSGW